MTFSLSSQSNEMTSSSRSGGMLCCQDIQAKASMRVNQTYGFSCLYVLVDHVVHKR